MQFITYTRESFQFIPWNEIDVVELTYTKIAGVFNNSVCHISGEWFKALHRACIKSHDQEYNGKRRALKFHPVMS